MRSLIFPFLWLAISAGAAPTQQGAPAGMVDLDRPGALEQLKRDRPKHYERVIAEMEAIQAVPAPKRLEHFLRFDPSAPDPAQRHIQTSDPAKTRATLSVEDVVYSFTVHYTRDPARAVPTK